MDDRAVHKIPGVGEAMEAAGATLYVCAATARPQLDREAFRQLKTFLCGVAQRTIAHVCRSIGAFIGVCCKETPMRPVLVRDRNLP